MKDEIEKLKKLLEEAAKITDDETIETIEEEFRGRCLIHLESDEVDTEEIHFDNYDEALMDLL